MDNNQNFPENAVNETPQYEQPQYAQPQYAQPQYAQPQYAQPQYAQPQYAQPQRYEQEQQTQYIPSQAQPEQAQQYAQAQYAQPQQAQQYAQAQYAQPQYGQQQYGQPQYQQYGQPQYGQPMYAQPVQAPPRPPKVYSANPVLRAYQKTASSVLFIIAISVYSAAVLFSLFGSSDIISSIASIALRGSSRWVSVTYGILGAIPMGLICAGLWIIFANGKSGGQVMSPVAGKLIKIGVLIQLIVTAVMYAIVFILLIVATVAAAKLSSYYGGGAVGGLVVADLAVAGLIFVEIFYLIKILKAANDLRDGLTGARASYLAKFIIIFNYIMAGIQFIAFIFAIIAGSAAAILTSMLTIGYLVLFNLIGSAYNKTLAAEFEVQPSVQQ